MRKLLLGGGACLLLLQACQTGGETISQTVHQESSPDFVSCIQPFEGLEIKPQVFEIEAGEKSVIKLKNGGKIEFPANAFVDASGKAVHGKVDVSWTEYHSLTDIMLSGIPMKYDSAGVQHDFQSGGMFTIKASQKDKELALAPEKKAHIDLASIQDTPCYSFYKIDEQSGKWDYITSSEGEKIPGNPGEKPAVKPEKPKPDNFALIDVQVDYSDFPELAEQDIVAWKTKNKIVKQHFMQTATKTKLRPGETEGAYLLEIENNKKTYYYDVAPYTLADARQASQKNEASLEKDFTAELSFQDDMRTGKILRSIDIETFGTYNWDCILHIPDHKEVVADFSFPEGVKDKSVSLFFICPELNASIRIPTDKQWENVRFDPKKRFNIVGIMADNSVVVLDGPDLDLLRKSPSNARLQIGFHKTGRKISRGQELAKVLNESI